MLPSAVAKLVPSGGGLRKCCRRCWRRMRWLSTISYKNERQLKCVKLRIGVQDFGGL